MSTKPEIVIASSADLPALVRFFRAVAEAEAPDDPAAPERGEAGLRAALAAHDFLNDDTCSLLLARVEGAPLAAEGAAPPDSARVLEPAQSLSGANGAPAGYILAVRIPKADARAGFLFVDEVYTLPACRRRGVARALLERAQALAGELGLAGVRLLVRGENVGARALYRACGFDEKDTIFCQWDETRGKGQGTRDEEQEGEARYRAIANLTAVGTGA